MEMYEKLRRMDIIKRNSKNYLELLITLTKGMMRSRFTKPVIFVAFIIHSFSVFLFLFASFSRRDIDFIMQYVSVWGLQVFMLINVYAVMTKIDVVKEFFIVHGQVIIPYEIMRKKSQRKVRMISKLVVAIVMMNYGLGFLSTILLTFSNGYLNEKSYIRVWICSQPGKCWLKLSIVYIFDVVAAVVMVSSPTAMVYFGTSGIFHLMLIHDFVKTICSSNIPEGERYTSELYQKLVECRLKICVMIHDQAIRLSVRGAEIIYVQIIMFSIGSIILGASLMLGILTSFSDGEYIVFLGLNMYGLCSLVSAVLYISIGQMLKNQSELIWYHLIQLPWYYMNKSNMKIYSVLLRKSDKPIAISSDFIEINFLLFVRIFRALYSAAALVVRMSSKD